MVISIEKQRNVPSLVSTCSVYVSSSLSQSLRSGVSNSASVLPNVLTDPRVEDQQVTSSCLFCFLFCSFFAVWRMTYLKAGPSAIRFWSIWHNRKSIIFVSADLVLVALDALVFIVSLISQFAKRAFFVPFLSLLSFHFCEWNTSHTISVGLF